MTPAVAEALAADDLAVAGALAAAERFRLTELPQRAMRSALIRDVLAGFARTPRELPPKYFYDAYGAALFDAICDTPEYYVTRTEHALLDAVSADIIRSTRANVLVELGSGAARKTRRLIDALVRSSASPVYMPIDISASMLRVSSAQLLAEYPTLHIDATVADYEAELFAVPRRGRRLIAFLGSTIGNFRQPDAVAFLGAVAATMRKSDSVLIGFDLAKSPAELHAAYNDAAGLTAEFNRNVLRVVNRELAADFDVDEFEHEARYLPEHGQIEMYLRARRDQQVCIAALGRRYHVAAGERIRTEISRKFVRRQIVAMLRGAGLRVTSWYQDDAARFALVVAGVASGAPPLQ